MQMLVGSRRESLRRRLHVASQVTSKSPDTSLALKDKAVADKIAAELTDLGTSRHRLGNFGNLEQPADRQRRL